MENKEKPFLLIKTWMDKPEADELLNWLMFDVNWKSHIISFHGKSVNVPRLLCWFGDVQYKYSGILHQPQPMPEKLRGVMVNVSREAIKYTPKNHFNSVLMNYYRNGDDSIGMHSDNEKQLGADPIIASLSFGDSRRFVLVNKETKQKEEFTLNHGDLLFMLEGCQEHWQHGIPKEKNKTERINLTFRNTYPL